MGNYYEEEDEEKYYQRMQEEAYYREMEDAHFRRLEAEEQHHQEVTQAFVDGHMTIETFAEYLLDWHDGDNLKVLVEIDAVKKNAHEFRYSSVRALA